MSAKITSRPPSALYAAGWDRIFGNPPRALAERSKGFKRLAKLQAKLRKDAKKPNTEYRIFDHPV